MQFGLEWRAKVANCDALFFRAWIFEILDVPKVMREHELELD